MPTASFCSAAGRGLQSCGQDNRSEAYCTRKAIELNSCRGNGSGGNYSYSNSGGSGNPGTGNQPSSSFCSAAGKGLNSCKYGDKSQSYCTQKSQELLSCRDSGYGGGGGTGGGSSTGKWETTDVEGYYVYHDTDLGGYYIRYPDGTTVFQYYDDAPIDNSSTAYLDDGSCPIGYYENTPTDGTMGCYPVYQIEPDVSSTHNSSCSCQNK
jgi:hypothetical protein